MEPKRTPSLISKGGYQIPPTPGVGRNRHPLGNRVKLSSIIHISAIFIFLSINIQYFSRFYQQFVILTSIFSKNKTLLPNTKATSSVDHPL